MDRIIIVGGGFTGCSAAVQLVRASAEPVDIAIVEPRAELGRGAAYSTTDLDHRLNGSSGTHFVDPADPEALPRWCEATRLLERDPEARAPNGQLYVRRADFARFVAGQVDAHLTNANGSAVRHLRDRAIAAREAGAEWEVQLAGGRKLRARLVVIATGTGAIRVPWPFDGELASHPSFAADPFDAARVRATRTRARVLIVGAGLTSLDIASTLLRQGHEGPITVLSRHGQRPRPQRPPGPDTTSARLFERLAAAPPDFIMPASRSARGMLRAMRARIREVERQGGDWYGPFDDVRDSVWKVWPRLDAAEKRRFLVKVRPWYDIHRFRTPPQNDAMVREAESAGRIAFVRGRLQRASALDDVLRVEWRDGGAPPVSRDFDAVINCTGLDASCGARDNPLLAALVAQGTIRPDPSGFGFEVDAQCRPIAANGRAVERLRIFGPPTAGTFGDPLGVLFIAPQVRRAIDGMLADLVHAPAPRNTAAAG